MFNFRGYHDSFRKLWNIVKSLVNFLT